MVGEAAERAEVEEVVALKLLSLHPTALRSRVNMYIQKAAVTASAPQNGSRAREGSGRGNM